MVSNNKQNITNSPSIISLLSITPLPTTTNSIAAHGGPSSIQRITKNQQRKFLIHILESALAVVEEDKENSRSDDQPQ
jgi:hypothetical protein